MAPGLGRTSMAGVRGARTHEVQDGYWLLRDGVRAFHPAVVHRVTAAEDTLTVLAPTVAPQDRSEMHDLVALTIELSSPTVDVIRVR